MQWSNIASIFLLLSILTLRMTCSFLPVPISHPRNSITSGVCNRVPSPILFSSTRPFDELLQDGKWILLNDFQYFLNQAAIQALIFLVNSLRDRHTAIWLEDFTQPIIRSRTKDNASDAVLSNMAEALDSAMHETQMERRIKLLTYHGLGAINTTLFPTWSYFFESLLQEDDVSYRIESTRSHVPTYEMEVNPASLCTRLISVRELIAREFVVDLDAVAEISETTMERFKEGKLEKPNLMFLDCSVHEDYLPSPLRKGNFDLLLTLTTQEAIHRILNSEFQSCERATLSFLYNFYLARIETHFTGSNWYGRAEDFLEQMLQSSPTSIRIQDSRSVLVDPVNVANLILRQREAVVEEWIELALDVPKSHADIKRWQLDRLMGREADVIPTVGFE